MPPGAVRRILGVVFVGRDAEMTRLETALAGALAGEGALTLISGEPGIGKSGLAEELSKRATARGACVAWGRAWEGEGTPAYWPWLEILRSLDRDARIRPVIAAARNGGPELAALLDGRELTRDGGAGFRLLDQIRNLLAAAGGEVPLVLVLDDLHVADAASLDLLAFVARGLREMRVLAVATTRDAGFAGSLAPLAKLAREASPLPLARLGRDDVAQWVQADAPQLLDSASRLFDTSEGNPLFVSELIAAWGSDKGAQTPLGIRDAIGAHLARVSPSARRVLEVASVFGRDVPLAALRSLTGRASAVDEALASSVLVPVDDICARFSHVLVRDQLYASLDDERRRELHRAAARHFAREPARAVRHALAAVGSEEPGEVVQSVLAAMREARGRLAFADAATLGERALEALNARLSTADEAALLIALGEALIVAGAAERGRSLCARAAELAAGDACLLARAALGYGSVASPGSARALHRAAASRHRGPAGRCTPAHSGARTACDGNHSTGARRGRRASAPRS